MVMVQEIHSHATKCGGIFGVESMSSWKMFSINLIPIQEVSLKKYYDCNMAVQSLKYASHEFTIFRISVSLSEPE